MPWKGIWRPGRERSSGKRPVQINNGNHKSNNRNAIIEGDNLNVTINNYIDNLHIPATHDPYSNLDTWAALSEEPPESNSPEVQTAQPFLLNDKSSQYTEPVTSEAIKAHVSAIQKAVSEIPVGATSIANSEAPSNRQTRSNQSLFPSSEYPLPKPIESADLKNHVPKHTERHIKSYMSTELFHSSHVIPLWNPSPCKGHARTWRTHVYIGDVGIFNHDGGFDTLFNIFHSAAENRERKRDPPDDFIPYHKNLSEIGIDIQDLMLASSTTTMTSGFVKDPPHAKQSDDRSTDLVTIGFPDKVDSTECSAIHLADGYVKISINQWEMPRLTEYLREQREAWQRHMDKITAGQFHDRSFVVIVASYRAKTWALAGGTKSFLSSKQAIVTLKKLIQGDRRWYFWESDDCRIRSRFGPSNKHMDDIDSYFRDMDAGTEPRCDEHDRKGTRECHCMAVGAYALQKKRWLRGGSFTSKGSSRSTVKSRASRLSMPTRFTPSVFKEAGY